MAKRRTTSRSTTKADREFLSEAEEILELMRGDLADLAAVSGDAEADPELINGLFRSAHSLKGLAGMFGLDPVHDLAHHLEDVLDSLRLGRVARDQAVVSLVDRAVARFGVLLAAVGDAEALEQAAAPIPELVAEIAALRSAAPVEAGDFAGLDLNPALLAALTEYEEHRLRENIARGRQILVFEAGFALAEFEQGLSSLMDAAQAHGEVLSTLPTPGEGDASAIRFSLLVASQISAAEAEATLVIPGAGVLQASRTQLDTPEAVAVHDVAQDVESLKTISETVRVDIRKLDELMNLVGEMVIERGALGDLIAGIQSETGFGSVAGELAKLHKGLDRKLRELQAAVIEVRMVPLRQVFDKISRIVRRLGNDLGKQVQLELHGADTELDKLIVEELVDPLMHVVRNAIDHALEPPDERAAAGKPASGTIRIEAFQRGNHVVISVSDDGRGIDTVALRARAESRGLVEVGEVLGEKETLDLVFAPGLSTRDEVSETSGRGVGMDVVRHNVTSLGGVVDIESISGRGATIAMTLPITLAIVQSLLVVAGGQRFAVPISAVHETLLVDTESIQRTEGRELLNLRGAAVPLRRLCAEFDLEPSAAGDPPDRQFVVVLGMGDTRVGLVVDGLDGQQDTVIKPIQGPVQTVRGIAGATELGGREPVLVLDVSAFLSDVGRRDAA